MSLDINLTGIEKTSNKKTTLTDNSDTFYPTQKAVKTAVDSKFNTPTGTTAQYLRGDGSLETFPTIPDVTGLQSKSIVVSTNQTAVNDGSYTVVANATFTDPSPVEGKGYRVFVRNGTATINSVAYTEKTTILRIFHSGAWLSYVSYANATTADIADSSNKRYQTDNQQLFNDATSSIQTQLDAKQSKLLVKKFGASATIDTTIESIIGNVEILGGTLASTDYLSIKSRARKTGGVGTYLLRYYLNTTSNSLTGATQIAISGTQTTTSIISASFEREFTIDGGNLIGFPFGTASNDGTASASTVSSVAYTVATTYYIITTITLVSALDTASLIGQKITNF